MLSLFVCCGKSCCLTTIAAFYCFLFCFLLLFVVVFLLVLLFLLLFRLLQLLFFFDFIQQLQSTELLSLQFLILLVYYDSHEHLDCNFIKFFAHLIDLSIFVGLYVVDSRKLVSFCFLFLKLIYSQGFQMNCKFFLHLLL